LGATWSTKSFFRQGAYQRGGKGRGKAKPPASEIGPAKPVPPALKRKEGGKQRQKPNNADPFSWRHLGGRGEGGEKGGTGEIKILKKAMFYGVTAFSFSSDTGRREEKGGKEEKKRGGREGEILKPPYTWGRKGGGGRKRTKFFHQSVYKERGEGRREKGKGRGKQVPDLVSESATIA